MISLDELKVKLEGWVLGLMGQWQAWTPNWTSLAGVVSTNSGKLATVGNIVFFSITLQGTNLVSTLTGTYFALPIAAAVDGVLHVQDITSVATIGQGLIRAGGTNRGYTPAWSATGDWIIITGWYER